VTRSSKSAKSWRWNCHGASAIASLSSTIRPEFVEFIPKELEDGVLYVSVPYGTTVHKCACGCGNKVTLPINSSEVAVSLGW
jgi:hypothetical protein